MYNIVQVLNRSDDHGDHYILLAIAIEDYRDKPHFMNSPHGSTSAFFFVK
jgi:hypothetical protein